MRVADIILPTNTQYKQKIVMPLVIAKAGINHSGKMDTAKRLIDDAADGGAHAIKFQAYKATSLVSKKAAPDLLQQLHGTDLFWKTEFEALKEYCDHTGIEFLATPFDVESTKFLNDLVEVFKISSPDITNKPFIQYICSFGKPIILSTGAAYPHEIVEAVSWIEPFSVPLVLLHSVLQYPTPDHEAQLGMIQELARLFPQHTVGYSDHTFSDDIKVLEIATLLGARILEKHFTYDKNLLGSDHYHAMDKNDLKLFFSMIERTIATVGNGQFSSQSSEKAARDNARRSLVLAQNIKKGETISPKHLTWKRPATGISPKHFESILGMKAAVDIEEDIVLQWSMLD